MAEQLMEPRRIYAEVTDTPTSYVREGEGAHPPMDWEPYKSTALRHPRQPLVFLPQTITEVTGPALGERWEVGELDHGLTRQHAGEPIGERIVVSGRVLDSEGKPLARTLVGDLAGQRGGQVPASRGPLARPAGSELLRRGAVRDRRRGSLRVHHDQAGPVPVGQPLQRLAPGAHPLLADGRAFAQRLVTQMYFPGDPFFEYDPIFWTPQ
jgi:protocatechuate 3,4-dioxygenase, beta subunit